MKSILGGLIVSLMTITATANTTASVFKTDSLLPVPLQEKIMYELKMRCPQDISAYGLKEVQTKMTVVDEADRDAESATQFETAFVSKYLSDGMHPSYQEIKVLSSTYNNHMGKKIATIHRIITQSGCEY